MHSWLVLLTACLLPAQAPGASGDGIRPKAIVVKAAEYEAEWVRLQNRKHKLTEDAEYLEALLAKKKADVESATADLKIYELTHVYQPVDTATKPARLEDPDRVPPPPTVDDFVELMTEKETAVKKAEVSRTTYRGRVVDTKGRPIAGASVVVELDIDDRKLVQTKTDDQGDYSFHLTNDVANPQPGTYSINFGADGFLARVVDANKHGDSGRRLIKLEPGVSLKGSVIHQGQKVPRVKVVIRTRDSYADTQDEWTSITNDLGEFSFENLPADHEVELSFDRESLKNFGVIGKRKVRTASVSDRKSLLDPIEVGPGRKVAGQVVFSDGMKVPEGSSLYVVMEGGRDKEKVDFDPKGRFEVTGLTPGQVSLVVLFWGMQYSVEGYRLSTENVSLDHSSPLYLTGIIDRDITDLKILFEPGEQWVSDNIAGRPHIPVPQADLDTRTLTGVLATSPKK